MDSGSRKKRWEYTPRTKEALALLASGKDKKEAARIMGITVNHFTTHIHSAERRDEWNASLATWTSTPPSKPGFFWARGEDTRGSEWTEVVHWDPHFGAYETGNEILVEIDDAAGPPTITGWLWWPIPLTPPPHP